MLKRKLWRMSFFCQGAYLIIAASNGSNLVGRHDNALPYQQSSDTAISKALVALPAVKLNPRAEKFVTAYVKNNNEALLKAKERSLNCFDMMDSVLASHSLPVELKYLAVVESDLKANALSHVGAAGPWQLMPQTARILGLKVTKKYDERRYFKKSTVAAARYMKDLYAQFGDWLLVIAAYNGGPAPVYKAIRKSGSRNFWKLQHFLPAETRGHVKRYIGTHYFFEGQGSITTLTKAEMDAHLKLINETYAKNQFEAPVVTLPVEPKNTLSNQEIAEAILIVKPRL